MLCVQVLMSIEQLRIHKRLHVNEIYIWCIVLIINLFLVTLACAGGFLDVAKILISNGATVNLGQSTPLMEASQEGHVELVQYLIQNNADVNQTTPAGETGNVFFFVFFSFEIINKFSFGLCMWKWTYWSRRNFT